jgi:hypothetical protein
MKRSTGASRLAPAGRYPGIATLSPTASSACSSVPGLSASEELVSGPAALRPVYPDGCPASGAPVPTTGR